MKKIRVFIGLLGLDQHEVGAIAIARMLRDAGMEVIYAGRFNMPPMIVQTSIHEDVDVVGLSCHSWEYIYYLPELIQLFKDNEVDIPIVLGGSIITPRDVEKIREMGVAAAFGPSSSNEEMIETIKVLASKRKR